MVVETFIEAAIEAGRAITALSARAIRAGSKLDGSPVTPADLRAEELIRKRLGGAFPSLRIIGEEGDLPRSGEVLPERLILVDPLDGTRDFLGGSPEFTVNIAFLEKGRPMAGVVHAPALGRLFAGSIAGAFEMAVPSEDAPVSRRLLRVRKVQKNGPLSLESRSHRDEATQALLEKLAPAARREVASSLKFGLIAVGEGDISARAASLNEWDIAAGEAVLTGAGGAVLTLEGRTLRYGDPGLKAPPFIAIGDPGLRSLVLRLRASAAR